MADQFEEVRYKQFDQVHLRTVRNVKYLSAPPGTKATPKGVWSVATVVENDLILVKHNVTIRIPASDVLKIADYNVNEITHLLGRLLDHGERQRRPIEGKEADHPEES